jgi:transposase
MLAELVDHVVSVDPDRDWITVALIEARTSGVLATERFPATGDWSSLWLTDTRSVATVVALKGVPMPRPHPPEFRLRAVELARLREKPVAQIAEDLGISDSCLRSWLKQADLDDGCRADGLTTAERQELVELRRELRVAKMEIEILKRASAYFAKENVLPK